MANRTFQTKVMGFVKRKAELYAVVSVGAAGAVTLKKRSWAPGTSTPTSLGSAPTSGVGYDVGNGEGVRSVARTDTGKWTVTLSDSYMYLIGVELVQTANTSGLMTAATVGVDTDGTNVTTNTAQGNGGTITLVLNDFAGAAVDPASGDTLTLLITLGDASEP